MITYVPWVHRGKLDDMRHWSRNVSDEPEDFGVHVIRHIEAIHLQPRYPSSASLNGAVWECCIFDGLRKIGVLSERIVCHLDPSKLPSIPEGKKCEIDFSIACDPEDIQIYAKASGRERIQQADRAAFWLRLNEHPQTYKVCLIWLEYNTKDLNEKGKARNIKKCRNEDWWLLGLDKVHTIYDVDAMLELQGRLLNWNSTRSTQTGKATHEYTHALKETTLL